MFALALLVAPLTAPDSWRTLSLRPLEDVPLELVRPGYCLSLETQSTPRPDGSVAESLRRLLEGRFRLDGAQLEVDSEGAGENWQRLDPEEIQAISWFVEGRTTRLQFFKRGGGWWCSSGEVYEVSKGVGANKTATWFLDADADGEFLGPRDLVRFGPVPFRPLEGQWVLDDGDERIAFRLVPGRGGKGMSLQVRDAGGTPESASREQALVWTGTNRMRNRHGFPPLAYHLELSRALTLHTEYLQHHDPNKKGTLSSYFGEDREKALYTEEGDAASRRGSVNFLQQGQTTASFIEGYEQMTHSRRDLFFPGAGRIGFGQTKAWCFLSLEPATTGPSEAIWVMPGAGARDVRLVCNRNWPYPKDYPTLYEEPRGTPISVQVDLRPDHEGAQWEVETIALRAAEKKDLDSGRPIKDLQKEVPGFFFPLTQVMDAPCDTWFFVPGEPLQANMAYEAVATLKRVKRSGEGAGVEMNRESMVWTFRCGGG